MLGVSIVVPVYNVAPYIESCLKSVMGQTYAGDMECLLVDDCGSDGSMAIAERMIGAYTGPIRFQILHHEHNRGLSAARNTGTDAATGDYVLFLDSDDELTQDCIERLVRPVLEDVTIEMVDGNHSTVSNNKQVVSKRQERMINTQKAVRDFYFCKRGFYVNAWNKLVSKRFIEQHQICFKEGFLWEDALWTFFLLKHLRRIYILSDITYKYNKRPYSITTGTDKGVKAYHLKNVYEVIADNFTLDEAGKEAKYYINGILSQIVQNPNFEELYMISSYYLKALYDDHYILTFLYSHVIITLSRLAWGRAILLFVLRILYKILDR